MVCHRLLHDLVFYQKCPWSGKICITIHLFKERYWRTEIEKKERITA